MSRVMAEYMYLRFQYPEGSPKDDGTTKRVRKTYIPDNWRRKRDTSFSQIADAEKKNEMMERSLRPGDVTVEAFSKELPQEEPSEGGKNDTLK